MIQICRTQGGKNAIFLLSTKEKTLQLSCTKKENPVMDWPSIQGVFAYSLRRWDRLQSPCDPTLKKRFRESVQMNGSKAVQMNGSKEAGVQCHCKSPHLLAVPSNFMQNTKANGLPCITFNASSNRSPKPGYN